jgi:peptidylprolyl isomerase
MKIGFIIFSAIVCIFFSSCGIFNTAKLNKEYTTKSGLKYTLLHTTFGKKAQSGDIVKVHYKGMLENGVEFDNSYIRKAPLVFRLGTGRVIKGWDEGIALLRPGEKARFVVPPLLGYNDRNVTGIPANSTLVFEVELLEIIDPPKPFDVSGKDTIHFESGLKFVRINNTTDKEAESFRTVSVHYTGYLTDGTIFDSSVERGQPFVFTLGKGQVIRGWDEGISKLKIGEKARLFLLIWLMEKREHLPLFLLMQQLFLMLN